MFTFIERFQSQNKATCICWYYTGCASLRHRNLAATTVLVCEPRPYPVWFSCGPKVASHAGVFRGARILFLPTNDCSTENNIPFPLFYSRGK